MTAPAPKRIRLMEPYVPEAAIASVVETLRSGWIGEGPRTRTFEERFSERMNGRACAAVGSCTDALYLAYQLSGIRPGDSVLAPLFTCTAGNEALLYKGTEAAVRFIDIAPNSLNIDGAVAAKMIDDRTRAVVVVHYGGAPVANMGTLRIECVMRGIPLIEDCAQALGGKYSDGAGPLGTRGDYSTFSFQAVKHISTPDGGMLVLPDTQLERVKRLRWFGIDRVAKQNGTWANDITEVGFKFQCNDVAAAMGLAGLDALDAQIVTRRAMRDAYARGLAGLDGIRLLDTDPESACWLCTVLVENREDLRRKLIEHGIESDQVHYRNDRYSIFAQFRGEFPNMDALESKYLVLPMHMGMDCGDVDRICAVIKSGW